MPIPLNIWVGTVTATSVQLEWDQVGVFDEANDEYKVQQSIDNGVTWTDVTSANGGEPTTNSTTVTALTTATSYQFQVAYHQGATPGPGVVGDYSKTALVTTL